MNKENKKRAQEARAQKRAKEEKKNRIANLIRFWGPIVLTVVVLIVLIVTIATSGADSSQGGGSDESQVELNFTDEDGNVYELTDVSEVTEEEE